jgi:Domain of unknown function (DUF4383)
VRGRTAVQIAATIAAAAFVAIGILGLVPGATTHYGDLAFAGHASRAKLFGVFRVSILQDLVHLAIGSAGLGLARTLEGARTFLRVGGAVYLVLWLLGVVAAGRWIPVDTADNWLHFVLGLSLPALGAVTTRGPLRPATA